jgi:hypothetical protein
VPKERDHVWCSLSGIRRIFELLQQWRQAWDGISEMEATDRRCREKSPATPHLQAELLRINVFVLQIATII